MSVTSKEINKASYEAPDSFYCPITGELMIDPVILPVGRTVEREAIVEWINNKGTCPFTRNELTVSMLTPNLDLKDIIEETKRKYFIIPRTIPVDTLRSNASKLKDIEIVSSKWGHSNIITKLNIPESTDRQKIHVCAVFDKSGSMGNSVVSTNSAGKKETDGTLLIDLVKQSVKTLVKMLDDDDQFSFITFNNSSEIIMNPTSMNSIGKTEAISKIDSILACGGTNIWNGISTAMELVKSNSCENILTKIIVFTDGQSNSSPPKGEIGALKDYSEKNGGYPCTMDFIGFGSGDSINTEIGYPLANITGGRGYYISDGSMIGNVFSSLTGLLISCLEFNTKLYFSIENSKKDSSDKIFDMEKLFMAGYNPEIIDSNTISIETGPLIYGTERHFRIPLLPLVLFEQKDIKVSLVNGRDILESPVSDIFDISYWKEMDSKSVFIDVLSYGFYHMKRGEHETAIKLLNDFESNFSSGKSSMLPTLFRSGSKLGLLDGILRDANGEVRMAFELSNFNKWGKHYIPLLKDAHVFEYCNNFKDEGIQGYASKFFDSNREKACEIFEKTPLIPTGVSPSFGGTPSAPRTIDTSRYGISAGCFHGLSEVYIADPLSDVRGPGESNYMLSLKKKVFVKDVKPGDKIFCGNKKYSIVEKILVTRISSGKFDMVTIDNGNDGKWIGTPNHPVKKSGEWVHPKNIGSIESIDCDATYSFLFQDRNPSLIVNGIESVSLAHGLKGNVVEHDLFGEEKIVDSMKSIENVMGYYNVVTVEQDWFYRNADGLIEDVDPYSNANKLSDLLDTKKWHCEKVI